MTPWYAVVNAIPAPVDCRDLVAADLESWLCTLTFMAPLLGFEVPLSAVDSIVLAQTMKS